MPAQAGFILSKSGSPLYVPNSIGAKSGDLLQLAYVVAGSPRSLSVSIQGLRDAGEAPVLDIYRDVFSTARAVNLKDDFGGFLIFAVWTGGSRVSVGITIRKQDGSTATG